jgi:hypothetical protein
MRSFKITLFAAASTLAILPTVASAEVVCNEDGDCWRTKTKYDYKPEYRLTVRPDSWTWDERDSAKYRWREHDGRGYWNKGVWVEF